MALSMHSTCVPIYLGMLGNLSKWLDKALAHAQARGFDPDTLLTARLAPDMLSLAKQVQIACDGAKFCVARLAGIDAPNSDDIEASLDALRERIRKTIGFVQSASAAQIDASEDKEIGRAHV